MYGFATEIGRSARTVTANRALRRLTAALVLAEVSAPVYYTASGIWAFREGGAMLAAVLGIVALVPAAAVAPAAAVIADRARREVVMAASLGARAVLLGLLAAGIAMHATWLVLATACAASICARMFYPALASSLPALTGSRQELVSANAVVSGTEHVGSVVGPALAGLAVVAVSPAAVCVAAAAGTLAAAAALAGVTIPRADSSCAGGAAEDDSHLRQLTAGFRQLLATRETRALVGVHVAHTFAFGMLGVALIQLALDDLRIGAPGLGLLEGALAVGGIAGGAVALGRAARHSARSGVRLGAALWSVPFCAAALLVDPVLAVAAIVVAGVGNVLLDVAVYTHVQETAQERVLARTVAALQSLAVAAVGLGSLAAGIALTRAGTVATLLAIGLAVPAATVLLVRPSLPQRPPEVATDTP